MDQGQIRREQMQERLYSDQDAYTRVLAVKREGVWVVRHLTAVVGQEPPGWAVERWQYEDLLLTSEQVKAHDLAKLLAAEEDKRTIWLSSQKLSVPESYESGQWRRHPSYSRNLRPTLPWPVVEHAFSGAFTNDFNVPHGFLVGPDAPSFTDPNTAFRAFFEGNRTLYGASSISNDLLNIRFVDERGYIGPIHGSPVELRVEVLGADLSGATLEMYTDERDEPIEVTRPGAARFPLDGAMPDQTWLWLKHGTEWLDYRALSSPWVNREHLQAAGVTIDVPEEPSSAIEALLFSGEGPTLEYKSKLPETAEERRHTFKTVAAFANGRGGRVVFGIDRDELTATGIEGDPTALRDQLTGMVRSRVIPTPDFEVVIYSYDEKNLLVLNVEVGNSPPYGISVDDNSKERPEFYVRRGANSYPAQPSDLREAVLVNVEDESSSNGWLDLDQ